jgi:hypothetical protein
MHRLAIVAVLSCVVLSACGGAPSMKGGVGGGGDEGGGDETGGTGGGAGSGGTAGTEGVIKRDAAPTTTGGAGGGAGDGGTGGGEAGGSGGTASPDGGGTTDFDGGGTASIPDLLPGSTPIFDGKTLTGWVGKPGVWTVKDGYIDGLAQNGGSLLATTMTYDTFRVSGKANVLQSDNHLGICIWGAKSGTGYGGCIVFVPPSGSIWDYGGGGEVRTLPYVWMGMPVNKHAWNQFEILADAATGTVRMAVNGHEFPVYKKAGRGRAAVIGLQIHAKFSEVGYKDLAVEVNPKDKRMLSVPGSQPLP